LRRVQAATGINTVPVSRAPASFRKQDVAHGVEGTAQSGGVGSRLPQHTGGVPESRCRRSSKRRVGGKQFGDPGAATALGIGQGIVRGNVQGIGPDRRTKPPFRFGGDFARFPQTLVAG
jgi:hypothetical protein